MAPIRYASEPPRTADLVVVGGGILGAATAFHASRAGFRVVVLERRPALCTLTTAAAAGGYRLQLDDELDLRLVRETVDLLFDFEERTGQRDYEPGLRPQGYLWVTTDERRAEEQRRLVEAQRAWGVEDVELLGADDLREAFPFVTPHAVQARFRALDGLLDPKGLTFGLAAGSDATFVTGCEATGFDVRGDRLEAVRTARGVVSAETAVIAAGPFSGEVAAMAGVELPLTTVVRQKVVMPWVPQVPSDAPMTIDDDSGAHWRPAFGGAYLLFTDPATPPSPPVEDVPTDGRFALQLLDPSSARSVARVAPFWAEVWERGSVHWMLQAGHYAMTPDRHPLLGRTGVEGLYVNTGYSGRGVMAGPGGSRHLVDLVAGKLAASDNPFALDREFPERAALDPL